MRGTSAKEILMTEATKYAIVGGGLAAASAVKGIRELDVQGPILLLMQEPYWPYHRPPLSKQLWSGKKKVQDIFVDPPSFYDEHGVKAILSTRAVAIDPAGRELTDSQGRRYRFEKLLLATGGAPRRLAVKGGDFSDKSVTARQFSASGTKGGDFSDKPGMARQFSASGTKGGDLDGVCYFRTLDDYLRVHHKVIDRSSAVVVGGGFIGSEIAAALCLRKVSVTMLFPSPCLCERVFPRSLGLAMNRLYQERGIRIVNDRPTGFESAAGDRVIAHTQGGEQFSCDIVIVGVGIDPAVELATDSGLEVGNGVVVDEFLQTSHPDIYAAGDNAFFPCRALGRSVRNEHWDNAQSQGRQAGRNMAGAGEPFTYLPYFFSDLFEFGYEAVGDVDARLETVAEWQEENRTGTIYYLRDHKVCGVMMCNMGNKMDAAREMILRGETNPKAESRIRNP